MYVVDVIYRYKYVITLKSYPVRLKIIIRGMINICLYQLVEKEKYYHPTDDNLKP
jgi:hypothetical protein